MKYTVAIVGGGFSALVLACSLNEKLQTKTLVFEKLSKVGKKILSTGNGRGNFTNEDLSPDRYHGGDPSFVEYAIKKFDNRLIRGFFAEMGVLSTVEDGRVYPLSLQANALLDCLRLSHKAAVMENGEVYSVKKDGDGFLLDTAAGIFRAENVVIAAGGTAAKNFGSDGSSYKLLKPFGHATGDLFPSLVQMRAESAAIKGLKGVKVKAKVALFDGDKLIRSTEGDLLFTDYGVSGNTVFYLSSYLPGLKEPRLLADLAPEADEQSLKEALKSRIKRYPDVQAEFLLSGVVHSALSLKICKGAFNGKKLGELSDSDVNRAVDLISNYGIKITGTLGFDYAQVTRGGILTKDVCDKTMESKLCKNLFICGEALDIDGDCGGYNLQWAFSSAKCVAEALNERYSDR